MSVRHCSNQNKYSIVLRRLDWKLHAVLQLCNCTIIDTQENYSTGEENSEMFASRERTSAYSSSKDFEKNITRLLIGEMKALFERNIF